MEHKASSSSVQLLYQTDTQQYELIKYVHGNITSVTNLTLYCMVKIVEGKIKRERQKERDKKDVGEMGKGGGK